MNTSNEVQKENKIYGQNLDSSKDNIYKDYKIVKNPVYKETAHADKIKPPGWNEKAGVGLTKFGLGLGCVACGVLSLALLPVVVIGKVIAFIGAMNFSDPVENAGKFLASPLLGLKACVDGLKNISVKEKLGVAVNATKSILTEIELKFKMRAPPSDKSGQAEYKKTVEAAIKDLSLFKSLMKQYKNLPIGEKGELMQAVREWKFPENEIIKNTVMNTLNNEMYNNI